MRRSLTLTALLIMALYAAACGGGGTQQAERAASPQEKQAAPVTQKVAKESAPQKSAPQKSAPRESAPEGSTSREKARGGEAAGLSVTTIEGERVTLGGQGDVTALYFMAGW